MATECPTLKLGTCLDDPRCTCVGDTGARTHGSHVDHQKLDPGDLVILERRFHNTNLILQVIEDTVFQVYWLNIHRDNDTSDHNIWGLFVDREDAIAKFDMVTL